MKNQTLLSVFAMLGACASGPPLFSTEGTPVPIPEGVHVGQLVAVPQALLEDSRCPMDARCVWAGRVVLSTRIYGPDFDETVPLHARRALRHARDFAHTGVGVAREAGGRRNPGAHLPLRISRAEPN